MRGNVNDLLRTIIGWTVTFLGWVSGELQRFRILFFSLNQERLKRKYSLSPGMPILSYGPELVRLIQAAAIKAGPRARLAETSGSTGKAKQILYTKRRLFELKLTFSDMFARACHALSIKRTSLYVFNSFQTDTSLTSLLLGEYRLPNYLSTLQAPYRVQHHSAIQALVSKYGPAAVRFWILAISNPGVLYSTNPSTISTFLDELVSEWCRSSKLIKDWCEHPASFSSDVHRIARRLESRGCAARLQRIALSGAPLPLSVCAPAVEAFICWTGGYVKPFLDRLARHLPSPRYRLIPMYSMSTESVETVPYFQGEDVAFLPIAGGVVYEFIEENNSDNLLSPQQLESGKLYAMVVSDGYGLRRYQTGDLFLCKRKINGLPDLTFAKRQSLGYSFTGEKLTAEQLSSVFEKLRAMYPALVGDRFLTCVPSQPANALPHYSVVLIGHQSSAFEHDLLATVCDELLAEINCEYQSKRASGRLGPMRFMEIEIQEFAERLAENGYWENQFKFLPLSRCPQ